MAAISATVALYRALIKKGVLAREEAMQILLDEAVAQAIQAEAQTQEPGVPEPTAFRGQRTKQFAIGVIVLALAPVAHRRSIDVQKPRGASLRQTMTLNNMANCRMTRPRRQKFFPTRSFNAALSSICSAKSFLSRRFSSSSARSRLASDASMPPNLAFHL
jgi:hypothetical protein